jgi:bis(5'-nucleosyl)-tetraphosphatase (symmetrical)
VAIYAIGDVQGCYDPLCQLLDKISFDAAHDQLWFAGDLVNRGPQSLAVLRFIKSLGDNAKLVLGNHDLHLLAVSRHAIRIKSKDTFQDVLNAEDSHELLTWLKSRKLMYYDANLDIAMVHAGLAPQWSIEDALKYAAEVEAVLQSDDCDGFFSRMYGNQPDQWSSELTGWERMRFITNTFTRIRFCDIYGKQILSEKGEVGSQPDGFMPWFEVESRASRGRRILFGHWAALGASYHGGHIWSLDSGCAWGGFLSALRIDQDWEYVGVECRLG